MRAHEVARVVKPSRRLSGGCTVEIRLKSRLDMIYLNKNKRRDNNSDMVSVELLLVKDGHSLEATKYIFVAFTLGGPVLE